MKKSLSLILSIALVFSMFSSLAFAADQSIGEKLKAAGVISGNSSGDLMEDQVWKREDLAVLAIKLLGQVEEAQAAGNTHEFEDVDNPYYDGFISYAKEAGIFLGVSETQFGMNRGITAKQFAAVILRLLGFEFDYDTETEDLAVEHGLFDEDTNWLQPALRGDLYAALGAGIQVVGADGQTIAEKRQYAGFYEVTAEQKINSFKAVSINKLEVKFNAAVDADKAKISVKRGNSNVNIKATTYSDDNKTATLETAVNRMPAGEYTVTVEGISEKALTATTTVAEETVTSIEFMSDIAPLDRDVAGDQGIFIWASVYNQYGEDVVGSIAGLQINSSKGNVTNSGGKLKIAVTGSDKFIVNEKVSVSIVHPASGKYAHVAATVSLASAVKDIKITGLVKTDNKTLNVRSTPSEFWLNVEATDQYGYKVTDPSHLSSDVIVTVSNTSVLDVQKSGSNADFETINNALSLRLAASGSAVSPNNFNKGVSSIYMIPKTGGDQDKIDIEVIDVPKVDTLTISASDIIVAGEEIDLDFIAIDQFGNEMNNASELNAGFLSNLQITGVTAKSPLPSGIPAPSINFIQDGDNAKLRLDLRGAVSPANAQPLLITGLTSTQKHVQYTFSVNPEKVAQVVSGLKDVPGAIAVTATTDLKAGNVLVDDQYGRTFTADKYAGITYGVTSSDSGKIAYLTGSQELEGIASGTSSITVTLSNSSGVISGSEYSITLRAVVANEITGYKVSEIPTLYNDGNARFAKDLVVKGLLDNDVEVAMPATHEDFYKVTVTGAVYDYVSYAGGKLQPSGTAMSDGEVTGKVVIAGHTKDGVIQVYTSDVTVSKATRVPTTFSLPSDASVLNVTYSEANGPAAAIAAKAIVKDQYGVVINDTTDASLKQILIASKSKTGTLNVGDEFNVLVVYKSGATNTIAVKVQ